MITLRYCQNTGFVMPEGKWDAYIEGLVTQYLHGCENIDVTLGASLPFTLIRKYIREKSITCDDVAMFDYNLMDYIPLDEDGDDMKHNTIGDIHLNAAMSIF